MRDCPTTNALCVFHSVGHDPLSRYLHPKFKHVFCAIKTDGQWLTIDGRAGIPVFELVAPADFDLETFYRAQGFHVVALNRRQEPLRSPLMAATCVGAVKRVLGIRASWVLTPRQLYRYLTKR